MRLKLKEGTHEIPVSVKVEEVCTVPCFTMACSPFGK